MYKYVFENKFNGMLDSMRYTDTRSGTDSFHMNSYTYMNLGHITNKHRFPRGAIYDTFGELAKAQFHHYFKPNDSYNDYNPYFGPDDKDGFYERITAMLFFREMALTYKLYEEY